MYETQFGEHFIILVRLPVQAHTYVQMHPYVCMCMCICMYMYIYVELTPHLKWTGVNLNAYVNKYIYANIQLCQHFESTVLTNMQSLLTELIEIVYFTQLFYQLTTNKYTK